MILDERTEFADATSVGAPNSSTVNVGDIIDTQVVRDHGNAGRPLYLVIQVTTDIDSGSTATVSFALVSDSTTSIATNGTQTVHWASATIAEATLVAGYTFVVALPFENPAYEEYLGVQCTEHAGHALTGGAINAFLTPDPSKWKAYADATN